MEGMMDDDVTGGAGVELSKILEGDYYDENEDYEDDDPDAVGDPLYNVNLKQYLKEFLLEFSRQPYFGHFVQHTNIVERNALKTLGVQI